MLGIDIVYLPEFENKLKNLSLETVFLGAELSQNKTTESLAGVFAAKEAFFKAIGAKKNWLDVWVEKDPPSPKASEGQAGKPRLYSTLIKSSKKIEVSISHAGDYAIAVVMIKDEYVN